MKISKQWDMYRIAVLVSKGWTLEEYTGSWKKHGMSRELNYVEKESNEYRARNQIPSLYDGTNFSLEESFYHSPKRIPLPLGRG